MQCDGRLLRPPALLPVLRAPRGNSLEDALPNWQDSNRRSELPPDWERRRRSVFRRDGHQCTHRDSSGLRCAEPATDCDHIEPGGSHDESNLTSLCGWHHRAKSSREGAAAKAANWRRNDKKFRRDEAHPGLT